MRITTWNVNGFRAVLRRNGFSWIKKINPEFLCFQEIKAQPSQIDMNAVEILNPYFGYWNSANRLGYSGVVTFSKLKPIKVFTGLNDERFDGEGRFIGLKFEDFTLINGYFPSGRRDHSRVDYKLEFYKKISELVEDFHRRNEKIILCGDFNTAYEEIDLRNPEQNRNTSGFLCIERDCIADLLTQNLVDVFRKKYPNKGEYTWWTYRANARERNIGWRLDYFLISSALQEKVIDVIIHKDILGSDHCPVTLEIKS